ncbi:hypothetical protein PISL3812_06810 [Talaromyces islandicus]|uniref:Dienelactone hydrolase domain-containing protein n=1 Tax=Talaromyces islandicus TaxID=28573 RepID=A0A0U1M432_TALIS|nr:hypothetical protein PISL3812_06810 [Talaromyces islandicus]
MEFTNPKAATATATVNGTGTGNSPGPKPSPSGLEVTEFFGPKAIYGEANEETYSRKFQFVPEIGASGFTVGGMGVEDNKESAVSTRWKFEGWRMGIVNEETTPPTNSAESLGARKANATTATQCQPAKYQRVSWRLEENKKEVQVVRNPTLHMAFAFEHENKPFLLELEVEGKLRHRHHRALEKLVFPPRSSKASANARIDAEKLCYGINDDLRTTALGLNDTMIEKNCKSQGIEISGPKQVGVDREQKVQQISTTSVQPPNLVATKESLTVQEETVNKNSSPMTNDDLLALAHQILHMKKDQKENPLDMASNENNIPKVRPELQRISENPPFESTSGVGQADYSFMLSIARYISSCWVAMVVWLTYMRKTLEYWLIRTLQVMLPFLIRNRFSKSWPIVEGFFKAVRENEGAHIPIGAAGFCWGGKHTVTLAHGLSRTNKKPLIDAAFTGHPSLLKFPDDIDNIQIPTSFALAEEDFAVDVPKIGIIQNAIEKQSEERKGESKVYPATGHGFCVRADHVTKEKERAAAEAEDQAVSWFLKWFADVEY